MTTTISVSQAELKRYLAAEGNPGDMYGADITINCADGRTTTSGHVPLAAHWPAFQRQVLDALPSGLAPPLTADAPDIAVADMEDIVDLLKSGKKIVAIPRASELQRIAKKIGIKTWVSYAHFGGPVAYPMPPTAAAEGGDNDGLNAGQDMPLEANGQQEAPVDDNPLPHDNGMDGNQHMNATAGQLPAAPVGQPMPPTAAAEGGTSGHNAGQHDYLTTCLQALLSGAKPRKITIEFES